MDGASGPISREFPYFEAYVHEEGYDSLKMVKAPTCHYHELNLGGEDHNHSSKPPELKQYLPYSKTRQKLS